MEEEEEEGGDRGRYLSASVKWFCQLKANLAYNSGLNQQRHGFG